MSFQRSIRLQCNGNCWCCCYKRSVFCHSKTQFSQRQTTNFRISLPTFLQQLQEEMKIVIWTAVLCCLLAVCSAVSNNNVEAQWHVWAPDAGCKEVYYYDRGSYYRVYACDGTSDNHGKAMLL